MNLPAWQTFALNEGVIPEPMPGNQGLVLWLPGEKGPDFDQWERIGNVAGAGLNKQDGLCATAATSIQVRRSRRGFFGKVFGVFQSTRGDRSWTMPNGEVTEQVGERQTSLILVWPENAVVELDEARIRASWPQSQRVCQIGKRLFLVSGVEPPKEAREGSSPAPFVFQPQSQQNAEQLRAAEHLLAAARQSGDRRREIAALTDLGISWQIAGDGKKSMAVLEEALALASQFGDSSQENDVIGNLGVVVLTTGQRARGLELMQEALKRTQTAGDRFGEKMALERLGEAYSRMREPQQSLPYFERAVALALELRDKRHAAELLWQQGVQHAELGQRDLAIAKAEAAISLLRDLGNPQAGWLSEHLQQYRTSETGTPLQSAFVSGSVSFGNQGIASSANSKAGPSLLRMAISSVKSLATYLASGLKTVAPVIHQKRVETCATCEHHTGLRCKLCGCFTNTKAWLPHERCPIDKWPSP
jgi:tetratricopeptide (TPR) repeat protein